MEHRAERRRGGAPGGLHQGLSSAGAFRTGAPFRPWFIRSILGHPDAAYVDGSIAWLVYAPQPGLPEILGSGVGALVARIEGEAVLGKLIDTGSTDRSDVTVRGVPGIWLEGGAHEVFVVDADTVDRYEGRLAGNTLIWVEGGETYRLEVGVPLGDALEIAASMES